MLSWASNHIQKFNFIAQVFCEILRFKESCILRFLDNTSSSRTRFLQTCCFGRKYKKNIGTSCWSKKAYLNGRDFCPNPKNLTLGTFKSSKPSPFKLICKNWNPWLFLLYDVKLHGKKIDDPEILHSRQMGKGMKLIGQIDRTLLLRWVPSLFSHHRDDIDFHLQYGGTFL